MRKLLKNLLLFDELFGCRGNRDGGDLLLSVTNNGDGTATIEFAAYPGADSYELEASGDGVSGWTTLGTVTSPYIHTVNDQYAVTYFRIVAYSGVILLATSTPFGPVMVSGDTAGNAYGVAIDADAATVTAGYPEENWLFAELRSQGLLSKIVDGFLRGHGNNTANRRKLISLNQGTFPSGTITPSAGYVTYSSNGYGSFVTNIDTMISPTSHGLLFDTVDAFPGTTICGAQNPDTTRSIELAAAGGLWYLRLGNEGSAQVTPSQGAFSSGMLFSVRTSTIAWALYHYNGTTFSTVSSGSGLSGGTVAPSLPLFTGARNANGTPQSFSNGKERCAIISTGCNATEAEIIMETIWTYYDMKGWV